MDFTRFRFTESGMDRWTRSHVNRAHKAGKVPARWMYQSSTSAANVELKLSENDVIIMNNAIMAIHFGKDPREAYAYAIEQYKKLDEIDANQQQGVENGNTGGTTKAD